jgi:hypothetical protein
MRKETNSLTLGRAGFLGSGSAGFVVAVLNAASAACRESIGLRLSPAIRAPLYHGTPIQKRSEAKRTRGQRAKSVDNDPKHQHYTILRGVPVARIPSTRQHNISPLRFPLRQSRHISAGYLSRPSLHRAKPLKAASCHPAFLHRCHLAHTRTWRGTALCSSIVRTLPS